MPIHHQPPVHDLQSAHKQHRFGIAGAERFQPFQFPGQFRGNIVRKGLGIDIQMRYEFIVRQQPGRFGLKGSGKSGNRVCPQSYACCVTMAAKTLQEYGTGFDGIQQVKAGMLRPEPLALPSSPRLISIVGR